MKGFGSRTSRCRCNLNKLIINRNAMTSTVSMIKALELSDLECEAESNWCLQMTNSRFKLQLKIKQAKKLRSRWRLNLKPRSLLEKLPYPSIKSFALVLWCISDPSIGADTDLKLDVSTKSQINAVSWLTMLADRVMRGDWALGYIKLWSQPP